MSLWRHLWWERVYFDVRRKFYTAWCWKWTKKGNKKLNENENENDNDNDSKNENENEKFKKNKIVKDSNIQELIEEPKEIKSRNWLGKNKFKEILTIIDAINLVIKTK